MQKLAKSLTGTLSCEQAKADLERGGQGTGSYVDAALPIRLWSVGHSISHRLTTLSDNAKCADHEAPPPG
jgi:hypothetical protein